MLPLFVWAALLWTVFVRDEVYEENFWKLARSVKSPFFLYCSFGCAFGALSVLILGWEAAVVVFAFCAMVGAVIFAITNWKRWEFCMLAVGGAFNQAVVAFNGGRMPVSHDAMVGTGDSSFELGFRHELITNDTALVFFADWLYIPEFYEVFSIGDVLIVTSFWTVLFSTFLKSCPRVRCKILRDPIS